MVRSKIKRTEIDRSSARMVPSRVTEERVSFNFKRLRCEGAKFVYQDKDGPYFNKLIERFRDLCRMSKLDLTVRNSDGLRCHPIDFQNDDVTVSGFGNVGEDVADDAWQFQISSNEYGRVHGYFVGNIFYVVWLDPKHELYA